MRNNFIPLCPYNNTKPPIGESMNLDKYTITVPPEMFDFLDILQHSANTGKYEPDNWLKKDGIGCQHKKQYESINRHIAYCSVGKDFIDSDSGMDHRLHAAVRLLMDYTRDKRGLND